MFSGFERISAAMLARGAEANLGAFRNEVSPFASFDGVLPRAESDELWVDTNYGLVYDANIAGARAIYGPTAELPSFSVDAAADRGFLRIPFRRIPRISIRSYAQLQHFLRSIHSQDDDLLIFFRGQQTEYFVPRDAATREILFGDADALEPSLIPSASRAPVPLEAVMPEWCWLIRAFFDTHLDEVAHWASPDHVHAWRDGFVEQTRTYTFALFALALAQHYGLPSAGLDVTTDLAVALFFALTEMKSSSKNPQLRVCSRVEKTAEWPVLYLFGVRKRFFLDYERFRPDGFPVGRPDRQKAYFMHTGWGQNRNECATRLFVALYLDPAGDFPVPAPRALFPDLSGDPFARFLFETAAQMPPRLREYLTRLYDVAG